MRESQIPCRKDKGAPNLILLARTGESRAVSPEKRDANFVLHPVIQKA